jgi:hypothetical protein
LNKITLPPLPFPLSRISIGDDYDILEERAFAVIRADDDGSIFLSNFDIIYQSTLYNMPVKDYLRR